MRLDKFIKNVGMFVLILTLFTLTISLVNASCENSIIYYGTCIPSGDIEVSIDNGINNNVVAQTICNSGLFATHIGTGGEGCTVQEGDLIKFKIDGVSAGETNWDGNFVNFINLDGTPVPANKLPSININFNSNSNFKSQDNFTCSAHIIDPDGDSLQEVYSSITSLKNSSYSYISVQDMLTTSDCVLVSPSSANCEVSLSVDLPVGGVECTFYANDGKNNSESSSSLNIINTIPSLHSSIKNYTGLIDTELMFNLTVLDIDIEQIYSVSKNFQFGNLSKINNIYAFSWTSNDTGNYSLGFTVNDGYDSSVLIIPIEIITQGTPIQTPNPPPQQSSGGGSHRNYVKVEENETSGNGGGCYSYKDVESRNVKCIGKAGEEVWIKQRAFCWGNFTGQRDSYILDRYTCPLPPQPEVKEEIILPEEQKPQPPEELSKWWLWVIIGLVFVIAGSFTVYELKQKGVFDHNINKKFESKSYTPKKQSENIKTQTKSDPSSANIKKQKTVISSPSEPPRVSFHVDVRGIEKKIKEANKLFSRGKIDDVKKLIHEISSDYKIMNPNDREEVYGEYMKLYERIRSAQ